MFSKTQCRATVGDVAQGDAETFHVAVRLIVFNGYFIP